MSHITGGGLAANLARVVPSDVSVRLDRGSWTPPAVFGVVGELGAVAQADLDLALNMGVGMVAVVPADVADAAVRQLASSGVDAWLIGEVGPAGEFGVGGSVTLR